MKLLVFNLFLAVTWAALTEDFSALNLVAGFGLGYVALRLAWTRARVARYVRKLALAVRFALFYAWEVVLANLRVARQVLAPLDRLHPAVIAVPLESRTDGEITALANLTTFSPGTVSLHVSPDRTILYVHVMSAEDADAVRREIQDALERRILEVWR